MNDLDVGRFALPHYLGECDVQRWRGQQPDTEYRNAGKEEGHIQLVLYDAAC